jgi:hypothetical protein
MRQVLSFHLDSCDVKPVLYYDEPALRCDDDDVSVFILIHMLEKQDRGAIKIKIKMRKQNTEDTQYKRDTDLRGSPSVGYVHQRNCQVLSLLLSSKMKGYNL